MLCLVQGLKPALALDGALRAQLATMLSQTMKNQDRISGIPETAAPRRQGPLPQPLQGSMHTGAFKNAAELAAGTSNCSAQSGQGARLGS